MRISDVIHQKGTSVVTAPADEKVEQLVALLADNGLGAVVVTDEDYGVIGIAGERDVVKALRVHGEAALRLTVAEIMSAPVRTCAPEDDITGVAGLMTAFRVRHVPVVVDGRLTAIVSIGDIVKGRIDELQTEHEYLISYLHQ